MGLRIYFHMFSDTDRPWFLWSEDMTAAELRETVAGASGVYLQHVYMGRLMREARLREVWEFLTPEQIWAHWPSVQRHLGRRRAFWDYLLTTWRKHGLLAD